jgi:hypothetical protein
MLKRVAPLTYEAWIDYDLPRARSRAPSAKRSAGW